MENKAPKLRLIKGGKKEPDHTVSVGTALIIFSLVILAVLIYKAA